jgi:multicomponent Na+:H+ antiporter subunit D
MILASSLIPGVAIFFLKESSVVLRTTLNLTGAGVKLALVAVLLWAVSKGETFEARLSLLPNMDLVLRADALSLMFFGV